MVSYSLWVPTKSKCFHIPIFLLHKTFPSRSTRQTVNIFTRAGGGERWPVGIDLLPHNTPCRITFRRGSASSIHFVWMLLFFTIHTNWILRFLTFANLCRGKTLKWKQIPCKTKHSFFAHINTRSKSLFFLFF